MHVFANTLLVGLGATATMDAWSLLRRRVLVIPPPDFALVGRWIAHMPRGTFRHVSIAAAAPVAHERLLGWVAHYVVGMAFAALLVAVAGPAWLARPTLAPALLVGIVTVAAPLLLMQPGMGAGIAGSRTPRPAFTRLHSLANHAVFGVGLYAAGWLVCVFLP